MKKLLFVLFTIILLLNIKAQNIGVRYESCTNCETHNNILSRPSYAAPENMTTNFVTSDYGRRDNPGGTEWHKGVDLSTEAGDDDLGDHILAIESGTIRLLGGINDYKYIAIDGAYNFGYAHIFRNETPDGSDYYQLGDLFLKRMDFPNQERFAIIHYPADLATPAAATAISDMQGTVTLEGYTINVRNTVNQNEIIAPLGDAQGGNAHLHLHKFNNIYTFTSNRNNTKNPLEVVAHEEPSYSILFENDVMIERYGEEASSIKVRVEMENDPDDNTGTYDHGVMNVDQVKLEIRGIGGTFELIEGARYESRMDMGGRASTTIYPAWPNTNFTDIDGSLSVFGIDPFAYSTTDVQYPSSDARHNPNAGAPYDDYYFSDFVTRIADSDAYGGAVALANNIHEARYKDGDYTIRATLTKVTGVSEPPVYNTISIDNFRPYVKSVTILRNNEGGATLYVGDFNLSTSQVEGLDLNAIQATDNLYLEVEFSESMNPATVSAHIESNSSGSTFIGNSVDQKSFYFTLASLGTSEVNNLQTLVISGQDLAGHQLQTDPTTFVNYKTGASSWSNTLTPGDDRNYIFNGDATPCEGDFDPLQANSEYTVQSASTGECVYVSFDVDKQNPATYEPVVFSPVGSADPSLTYSWNFGTGAIPATSTDREVTVMYETEGPKTVSLQICSGGNCNTREIAGFMDVGAANAPLTVDFNIIGSSNRGTNDEIYFTSTVSNNNGPLSYSWDFGFGALSSNSNQASPSVNYFSIGSKNISLTVSDGLQTITKTKGDYLRISRIGANPINVTLSCPPNGGRYLELDAFDGLSNHATDGVVGNEQILWEFEDGQTSASRDLWVEFKSPGLYDIKLTICDDSGCSTATCQYRALEEYYSTGNYNFTINGQLAGQYTGGSYETVPIQNIAANFPLILNDATGNVNSSITKYYIYKGNAENPFMTIDDGPGPHEILLPDPNSWYSIYYQVGLPGQNFVPFAYIYADETSQISERCIARFGSTALGETCWDDINLPQFIIDLETNGCPIGLVELIDLNNGQVLTTSSENYLWPLSKKPTSFPYSTTIEARAYYDCGSGNSCTVLSTREFGLTINSFDGPSLNISYQSCVGASTEIGMEPDGNYSYLWSSVSGSDINYLSDKTISNPSFVAYLSGTHEYDLTITDNTTGCNSTERITINTTGIETQSYSQTVAAGGQAELNSPVVGGGSTYEYVWSPDTYLDNPRVANPIINAPDFATNITYTVNVSFRDCTSEEATVDVEIENLPPSDLEVEDVTSVFPTLTWRNNGVANEIRIQRSENGGSTWSLIGTVGGDETTYQDINCSLSYDNYRYRIRGYDVNGDFMGNPSDGSHIKDHFVEGVVSKPTPVFQVDVGKQRLLTPPVNGDIAIYSYDWGTSEYLDDPYATLPSFSAPNYGGTYQLDVLVDYNGICSTVGEALVVVKNYESNDLSVNLNGQLYPELDWENDPRGILKNIEIERSFNGGIFETLSSVGGSTIGYLDVDCIETGIEVCYRLKSIDMAGETVGYSNVVCEYIPYNPGIVQTLEHTIPGSGRAVNKKSLFNGFGGNTVIATNSFGNSNFAAADANTEFVNGPEESYFQLLFKDATYQNIQSSVITNSNSSIEFYPTSVAESSDYFYVVGYYERSNLPPKTGFIFRYTKSNGNISKNRFNDTDGNPLELTHPPRIVLIDDTPIVGLTIKSNTGVSTIELRALLDWNSNQWNEDTHPTDTYDKVLSDLDIRDDQIYLFYKVSRSNFEYERLYWYNLNNDGNIHEVEWEILSQYTSPENDPIHPQFHYYNDYLYVVSEAIKQTLSNYTIHIEKRNTNFGTLWIKEIPIDTYFEIRSFMSLDKDIIILGQKNNEIIYLSFDEDGDVTRQKSFVINDMDYLIGGEVIDNDLVLTYIRNSTQSDGEVASILMSSQPETLGSFLTICEEELIASNSYAGYDIRVAEDCEVDVSNTEELILETSNKLRINAGFKVEPGGIFSASIIDIENISCDDMSAGRIYFSNETKVQIVSETNWTNEITVSTYPNPSSEYLKVTQNNLTSDYVKLTLMDLRGMTIHEKLIEGVQKLDEIIFVGDLVKGLYILKIENQYQSLERKILVK